MILGFTIPSFVTFVGVSLLICVVLCALAMEASVLFTPAFLLLFPFLFAEFPEVTPNEAIGLAITVEFFGYTSSVGGYWFRRQIDFSVAGKILRYTVPLAVVGRILAYRVPEQGLMVLFGVLLLFLASVIYRVYRGETPHTCLLCGDSLAGMEMDRGEEGGTRETARGPRRGGHAAPAFRTRLFGSSPNTGPLLDFDGFDRVVVGSAGILAGLVGIAIGEISNTFLTVRKGVPVKISTGTSALVLHVTILAALAANLVVLASGLDASGGEELVIPWKIAGILAPVVIAGGQIGSYLNSRLEERTVVRALMVAYALIGTLVLGTALFA